VAGEAATVADVTEEFLAAAEAGKARNRNGRRYRPSALRDVAGCLRNYVVPDLGDLRLRDVQPHDLQRLVDELAAGDLSLSRIRSVVSAIRALYAYAIERGIVDVSAAEGIEIARVEEPLWEDGAYDADEADSPPHRTGGWAPAHTRSQRYIPRDPGERTVPELVLSFLLRLVVTVFVIMALIALAQALLLPA
jgi:hypothetical protein